MSESRGRQDAPLNAIIEKLIPCSFMLGFNSCFELIDCGFEGSPWRFGIDRFNIDEVERWFPSGGDWADEDGE
jgi:hypothetical protein